MYGRNVQIRFGGPLTPIVKKLLIINAGIFIIQQLFNFFTPGSIETLFGLSHTGLINEFKLWQLGTYMFLHGGWIHILFNSVALWMFGGELEQLWGSQTFFRYYIYSGIGAGVFIAAMNFFVVAKYGFSPITIGASGAIYAVLLAYGMTWPNREVLLYFVIPVKIKYLVMAFGLIEFFGTFSSATGAGSGISHTGHLGGLVSGFILLRVGSSLLRGSQAKKKGLNSKEGFFSRIFKKHRLKKKQKDIEIRIKAKKIIDELLEKIAREGMSSLSPEEKEKLEWARRNYYPDSSETLH